MEKKVEKKNVQLRSDVNTTAAPAKKEIGEGEKKKKVQKNYLLTLKVYFNGQGKHSSKYINKAGLEFSTIDIT